MLDVWWTVWVWWKYSQGYITDKSSQFYSWHRLAIARMENNQLNRSINRSVLGGNLIMFFTNVIILRHMFSKYWHEVYMRLAKPPLKEISNIWKIIRDVIKKYRMFDFIIFFCYAGTHAYCCYVDNVSHFGLSVCFWQMKRLVVFWCALRFFTIQKYGSKNV